MRTWYSVLGVVLALGLTLLSGLVHGRMSHRWGPPADMVAAGKRLEVIPRQVGPWRQESTETLADPVRDVLQCAGVIVRGYVNETTGERVKVALLLGPTGPMSVHTPDVCYSSSAYTLDQPAVRRLWDRQGTPSHSLWRTVFRSTDIEGTRLCVYHGWSDGGPWVAADNPRVSFADRPFLCKLQVAGALPNATGTDAIDAGQLFLDHFLPVAQEYLVRPSAK